MSQPNRSTKVNPRRVKECPEHGQRVRVRIGRGWKRCPVEGCPYTRR